jgi:antitoxin CcdA
MMSERQVKNRAVNLFVDADLLDEARRLRMMAKVEREKRWLEENREAIDSINSFIDRHGLLASRLRYRNQPE